MAAFSPIIAQMLQVMVTTEKDDVTGTFFLQ
jgi:hypothetical protein